VLRIPLQAVPNQTLGVTLARQTVNIALRQNGGSLYFDLALGDESIVITRICRDRQRLLLDAEYKGFQGEFIFVDTQGVDDPVWTGLDQRFALLYLAVGE